MHAFKEEKSNSDFKMRDNWIESTVLWGQIVEFFTYLNDLMHERSLYFVELYFCCRFNFGLDGTSLFDKDIHSTRKRKGAKAKN